MQHTRVAPVRQEEHPIENTDQNPRVVKKKVADGHLQKTTTQACNTQEQHPTDKSSIQLSTPTRTPGSLRTKVAEGHLQKNDKTSTKHSSAQ